MKTYPPMDLTHAYKIAENHKRRLESSIYQASRGMGGEVITQTERALIFLFERAKANEGPITDAVIVPPTHLGLEWKP